VPCAKIMYVLLRDPEPASSAAVSSQVGRTRSGVDAPYWTLLPAKPRQVTCTSRLEGHEPTATPPATGMDAIAHLYTGGKAPGACFQRCGMARTLLHARHASFKTAAKRARGFNTHCPPRSATVGREALTDFGYTSGYIVSQSVLRPCRRPAVTSEDMSALGRIGTCDLLIRRARVGVHRGCCCGRTLRAVRRECSASDGPATPPGYEPRWPACKIIGYAPGHNRPSSIGPDVLATAHNGFAARSHGGNVAGRKRALWGSTPPSPTIHKCR